jgi:hypothetical protein
MVLFYTTGRRPQRAEFYSRRFRTRGPAYARLDQLVALWITDHGITPTFLGSLTRFSRPNGQFAVTNDHGCFRRD